MRLQTEYLDGGAAVAPEEQPGWDHLGLVEHHKSTLGHQLSYIFEGILAWNPVDIHQELGVVAVCQWKFGYSILGEGIVIVVDVNYRLAQNLSFLQRYKM